MRGRSRVASSSSWGWPRPSCSIPRSSASPPAPPDVPGNDLLIQGGGGGAPPAFAAVLYELGPGSTVTNLTLTIAPNSAMTPSTTLQICPLLQPINHPEQGGPMSDAPPYN